jgi:predicted anti-sigma-YlaC factor YlaD
MTHDCFDIGTIQAFLDGELSSADVMRVSDHIEACDACAMLLAEAEDENAVVFPALAREMDSLVPSQRLWVRINDSIESERAAAPWYQKLYGIIVAGLASPSVAVAAGVLIIAGVFAIYTLRGPGRDSSPFEVVKTTVRTASTIAPVGQSVPSGDDVVTPTASRPVAIERASYVQPRKAVVNDAPRNAIDARPAVREATFMPGEESYVRTIASLSKSVAASGDGQALRASEQVAYQRNMALVDDTIAKMRSVLRKDPRNEAAKETLYTSYQNKIDLLSSVAQKEELVASLR